MTPQSSSDSIPEITTAFQPESPTLAQMTGGGQRRRRASMQDALDHTKINTSLYDNQVKISDDLL